MKRLISAAALALITASAAHAEVKVETRVFHSNLRLDASSNQEVGSGEKDKVNPDFFNTAGVGVSGIYAVDQNVDLGLGYSYARYYFSTEAQTDQHVISAFGRYNFVKTETSSIYALAGVSSQQFSQQIDTYRDGPFTSKVKSSWDPLLNGDIGVGGSIKIGGADLGLQYKYSNTLAKGEAEFKATSTYPGLAGTETDTFKSKTKGITAEGQEVALTLGLSL